MDVLGAFALAVSYCCFKLRRVAAFTVSFKTHTPFILLLDKPYEAFGVS